MYKKINGVRVRFKKFSHKGIVSYRCLLNYSGGIYSDLTTGDGATKQEAYDQVMKRYNGRKKTHFQKKKAQPKHGRFSLFGRRARVA